MMEPQRREGIPTWVWVVVAIGAACLTMVVLVLVFAAVLFPVFVRAREKARMVACQNNLVLLARAMAMYRADHNGYFPPAAQWSDAILPYHKNPFLYRCPAAPQLSSGYAFNSALSGKDEKTIVSPATTIMLYDSSTGTPNANDKVSSLAFRHMNTANVAHVDGSVTTAIDEKPTTTMPGAPPSGVPPPTKKLFQK